MSNESNQVNAYCRAGSFGAAALMNYNAMPVHVSCVRKQLWRITYAWKR